jgi:hypothetical protein
MKLLPNTKNRCGDWDRLGGARNEMTARLLVGVLFVLAAAPGGMRLGALQQPDLRAIASRDTDPAILRKVLDRLGAVDEPPEFWAHIVSDTRFSPVHRRLCLYSLFRRHAAGKRVDFFFALPHAETWFAKQHVTEATYASKVPVKRPAGQTVFMLRPELPPGNSSAIYLRLSGMVTCDEFLDLMRGKAQNPRVSILEVGINDVPD